MDKRKLTNSREVKKPAKRSTGLLVRIKRSLFCCCFCCGTKRAKKVKKSEDASLRYVKDIILHEDAKSSHQPAS